jgi:hypothetical protein
MCCYSLPLAYRFGSQIIYLLVLKYRIITKNLQKSLEAMIAA